jgi:hypothetical protein
MNAEISALPLVLLCNFGIVGGFFILLLNIFFVLALSLLDEGDSFGD